MTVFPFIASTAASIELNPPMREGLLAKAVYAAVFGMGLIGGFALRLYLKRYGPPQAGIPDVDYVTFEEAFKPLPPPPSERRGLGFALARFLFSRVDVFRLLESMVKGLESSGVLRLPMTAMSPLIKAQV